MTHVTTWAVGICMVFAVIIGQLIFPFAFDFVSTLAVFGVGVFMGRTFAHK